MSNREGGPKGEKTPEEIFEDAAKKSGEAFGEAGKAAADAEKEKPEEIFDDAAKKSGEAFGEAGKAAADAAEDVRKRFTGITSPLVIALIIGIGVILIFDLRFVEGKSSLERASLILKFFDDSSKT
eukprot:CAMPEP_0174914298 /NCGR_PEP_ID=MMETSP0167-20121228/80761_1 /TAXON_ID=38298 /ORGANISM="Rhodella maculata, Strain CCMP736" /LENGTH=125 /DNA_ID=CAMNT_0016159051 /DNA_START=278 /DNA_END=656 /DNA_ORIENTATION=-